MNTTANNNEDGTIYVKLCERIYNDTTAPVAIGDTVIYNKFKGETPRRAVVTGYDDIIKMYFLETEDGQNIATGRDGFAVCGPEPSTEEAADILALAYIMENGKRIKAEESKERVFCGYYAAAGYQGQIPGDLFAVLSGPCLVPCFGPDGHRLNVGEKRAGMSYHARRREWYHE